jgi:mono/diheme cytochrome c family protein
MRLARLGLFATSLAASSCQRAPDDLREWTPADHDHTQQPQGQQQGQQQGHQQQVPAGAESKGAMFGISEVVLAAWKQNCTSCHGIIGRGDGPQGPMVRAPDLTNPAFHASVSDADIAAVIRTGRGSMPAFPLPDSTVDGLVKLVRLLDRGRAAREAADAGADAAPPAPVEAGADGARR